MQTQSRNIKYNLKYLLNHTSLFRIKLQCIKLYLFSLVLIHFSFKSQITEVLQKSQLRAILSHTEVVLTTFRQIHTTQYHYFSM